MATNYLVYGEGCEEEVHQTFLQNAPDTQLVSLPLRKFLKEKRATEEDKVIVYGAYDEIKEVLEVSFIFGFTVALLARPTQGGLRDTFEIPKNPAKALRVALEGESRPIDLLYCQDEIVLSSALVGEAPPHGMLATARQEDAVTNRIWLLLKSVTRIFRLKKSLIRLKTFKEQQIETTASGIVILSHDDHSCAASLVKSYLSASNGKLTALIISPSSVVAYIGYLFKAIFRFTETLPKAVGVVLTQRLQLEAEPPLEVLVDGSRCHTTPVTFDVHKKAFRLCASDAFWKKESQRRSDEKEVIKVASLPSGEEEMAYARQHIPFLPHADTAKYQELFTSLREEARTTTTFVVLIILSTLLATVGLFLNSASVVIGAMLLAPLMQPIVSTSMGLLRFDMDLLLHGLRTVIIGVGLVLLASFLIAWILPFQTMTPEIAGRLHPTLLDLIVAIVSGIAAAYAKNNPKIIGSLAGVSIAVALVPPVATAGIGLGWHNMSVFQSAFLLFLTNFAGIIFAGALTFMILGFSAIKRATRGLLISLATLVAISVPLYLSFSLMIKDAKIKEILQAAPIHTRDHEVTIENIYITHTAAPQQMVLRCDVVTDSPLERSERKALKKEMMQEIAPYVGKEQVVLEALERYRY